MNTNYRSLKNIFLGKVFNYFCSILKDLIILYIALNQAAVQFVCHDSGNLVTLYLKVSIMQSNYLST